MSTKEKLLQIETRKSQVASKISEIKEWQRRHAHKSGSKDWHLFKNDLRDYEAELVSLNNQAEQIKLTGSDSNI